MIPSLLPGYVFDLLINDFSTDKVKFLLLSIFEITP